MKLAQVRRSWLMSTRELEAQAKVSRKTIMDIEKGRVTPSLSTIRKLSEALQVAPMDVDEFRDVIMGKELAPANA
jgi:DNA-binding XRE family transcriptional regulator